MGLLDVAERHAVVLAVATDLELGGLARDRLAVPVPDEAGRWGRGGCRKGSVLCQHMRSVLAEAFHSAGVSMVIADQKVVFHHWISVNDSTTA